jgi:hypothetical protein
VAGSGSAHRLERLGIDVLDSFGIKAPENAAEIYPQGERAWKRSEANRGNEKNRPDQLGNAAQDIQDGARRASQNAGRREISRRERPKRKTDHCGDDNPPDRDADRVERGAPEIVKHAPIWRHHASQIVPDHGQRVRKRAGAQLETVCAPAQERRCKDERGNEFGPAGQHGPISRGQSHRDG